MSHITASPLPWRLAGLLALFALAHPLSLAAQDACPAASGVDAEAGWSAYQSGDMAQARTRFQTALARCQDDQYARTGLGYVLLRENDLTQARATFLTVVGAQPENVDAQTGLGLIAWRQADLDEVHARFSQVVAVDPGNATALDYLSRLPEGVGPPPQRPPLVLPDSTEFSARTSGEYFEVRTADGWESIYLKGVNLGAALPGQNPSEYPDTETYREWIEEMADMGANMVRVYTIHPPRFYEVLRDWNVSHPDRVLWLIHGVWTEVPEDGNYMGAEFEQQFFGEMRDVVDLLHGRADLRPRPGHSSGFYTADVSEWTLAYIIGREWEPFSSLAFNSLNPDLRSWEGQFVSIDDGNPMEAWLTKALDEIVSYETLTYRTQRPVAYTNWPTLDPMSHVTEPTRDEEVSLREALGETVDIKPTDYDNDALGLDATLMRAEPEFRAGIFASYHAYPYYPDFMVLQSDYAEATSSFGPSNYFGYLQDLKAHHPGMPLIISEYGVPASIGPAHLQPQGQHHGGHTEAGMAEIDARLTQELSEAGMAGGALFSWIDEWFKKNWLTQQFERPSERNRLWFNRLDAEQHYGVFAMEPVPPVPGESMAERASGWRDVAALYDDGATTVRAAADAAYLWLRIDGLPRDSGDEVFVGLDMIDAQLGDRRWPGAVGPETPFGLEFVIVENDNGLRVMVDPPVNPFRFAPEGTDSRARPEGLPIFANPPPGTRAVRMGQLLNPPFISADNDDGQYEPLLVVPNRRRVSRDSIEYLALAYERGVLAAGPGPDGFWQRSGDALEIRIPWLLINVTDPSSRSVLASPLAEAAGYGRTADGMMLTPAGEVVPPDTLIGEIGTRQVTDIGIALAARASDGTLRAWPSGGEPGARFSWPTWETEDILWRSRRRPVFDAMRRVFAQVDYQLDGSANRVLAGEPEGVTGPVVSSAPAAPAGVVTNPASQGDPTGAASPAGADPDEAARAWAAGDLPLARRLYRAVIEADPENTLALNRLGLLAGWAGDHSESLEWFDRLLAIEPGDDEARIAQARVVAWSGDTRRAVQLLDTFLEERPGDASALEARATFLAWGGDYEQSLDTWTELLGVSTDPLRIRMQQAQVLSWAADYEASRAVYDSILSINPGDVDARLGLARVLTFAGDISGAEAEYGRVLEGDPADLRALQGLGRAQSWDGRLMEGERTLRRAVQVDPDDVGSLVGLGQNLRWQGRNAAALEVLRRAEEMDASNADVQEQLRWVRVALAPQVSATMSVERDSDENRMVSTGFVARFHPFPRIGVRADVWDRDLGLPGLDRTARGVTLSASLSLEPGWTLGAGLGASTNDGTARQDITSWRASLSTPGRHRATATLAVSQAALDATALLAQNGITTRGVTLTTGLKLPGLWRLDGGMGLATFSGVEDNQRTNVSLGLSRPLGRMWTLGLAGRTFSFDKDLSEGYFDPDLYRILELPVRWLWEPDSWSFLIEGAPGAQKVRTTGDYTGAWRVSARLARRFGPGRELSISTGHSTAGITSFSNDAEHYRYTAIIAGLTWTF